MNERRAFHKVRYLLSGKDGNKKYPFVELPVEWCREQNLNFGDWIELRMSGKELTIIPVKER